MSTRGATHYNPGNSGFGKVQCGGEAGNRISAYQNHALKREAIEIVSERKAINCIEHAHALVQQGWQEMIKERHEYGKKRKGDLKRGPAENKSGSIRN